MWSTLLKHLNYLVFQSFDLPEEGYDLPEEGYELPEEGYSRNSWH